LLRAGRRQPAGSLAAWQAADRPPSWRRSVGALFAVVLILAACERHDAARDQTLKHDLAVMRQAIEKYRATEGRYPYSLQELVPRYLRAIPPDPITNSTNTWRVTTEETVQPSTDFTSDTAAASRSVIVDVHSGAPGADRDGVLYSNY
jgi:general secretion pathway protein G